MNILFLTIAWPAYGEHNLYTDLMDEFVAHGHQVSVACSIEKRFGRDTSLKVENDIQVLRIKTGNLTKTPFLEKGISNLLISRQFECAIETYFSQQRFDLIIMSTPPITLSGVYQKLKKKYKAKTYLLLKDIWPQGIADLGLISEHGIIYRYFSWQEHRLYNASDFIGCMSPANVEYIKKHNTIKPSIIVEENPNSIKIRKFEIHRDIHIRKKYDIPDDKCVFLFGGNMGKPQGIQLFLSMLNQCDHKNSFFVFVGNGTEKKNVATYACKHKDYFKFIESLPKNEYELLCESSDVGLILLDGHYTIPNFPSRVLSYLENRLPVLCCTDESTDIGNIVETSNCGIKIVKGDFQKLNHAIDIFSHNEDLRINMGEHAFTLLNKKYRSEYSYEIVMKHFK